MFRIILHVFTSIANPHESWAKVKGEPDGVYAVDDIDTYTRLGYAKKRAKWRLEEAPYFPPLCYVIRAYVWDTENDRVVLSYRRGKAVEKEGPY